RSCCSGANGMTASRNPDRRIHAFLRRGEETLDDRVYDAVRVAIERTPQRAVIGPWRLPAMNKIVSYGLATAAIIVLVVLGAQFILAPRPANVGLPASATPEPTPDPTSSASAESVPSPTVVWAGLPRGPFVVTGSEDPVQVTLDIQ